MIPVTLNQVVANLQASDTSIAFLEADKVASLDYAQLGRLIAGNAEHFSSLGLRRGESVAISLRTDVEHIVTFLALVALGAIPVSIKPARTTSDVYARDVAQLCHKFKIRYRYHTLPSLDGPAPVAWRPDLFSNRAAVAEVEPQDIAFVQFSSGSTSSPKAIPISHQNLMANLSTILAVDGRSPDDTAFNFLPLSHDMGLIGGFLSNLVHQNSVLFTSTSQFLRRPVDTLEMASERHINGMAMPDFALRYLGRFLSGSPGELRQDILSNLRFIYCGAEPIRLQSVANFLQTAGPLGLDPHALFFCYGLAEATLLVTGRHFSTVEDSFDMSQPNRITARVGPPLGGVEVRICARDARGKDQVLEDGREGSVQLRGPSIFQGYWGEVPRPENDWFDTGDIGYMRDDELHICGRDKEMIIVNGENIFPVDIEGSLAGLPEVRESLVMLDEDQFYLLVAPANRGEFDRQRISSFICQHFGLSPKAVIEGTSNHIVRTTSGKPIRSETLAELRRRGLLPGGRG